jgi:hypothetical protein
MPSSQVADTLKRDIGSSDTPTRKAGWELGRHGAGKAENSGGSQSDHAGRRSVASCGRGIGKGPNKER